ncbi:MAG: tRNA lysidine(34) synthetase TilS [Fidelibacterota bacterium]
MEHSPITDSLLTLFRSHGPVKLSDRLIVAVSGGKDSMCLLHGLVEILEKPEDHIVAVHVNHNLRPDSHRDGELIASFCLRHDIPFISQALDSSERPRTMNLEAWCRDKRYAILEKYRIRENANWILTAHHAQDQTETLLMHLLQGSGVSGLRGIHFCHGSVLRPFLSLLPDEIWTYVRRYDVPFREDSTNTDDRMDRNYLRLRILPYLDSRFPGLHKAANRTAQIMTEAESALQYAVAELKTKLNLESSDKCSEIPLERMANVPLLLQVRLLQDICHSGGPTRNHNWNRLKQFLLNGSTGTVIPLGRYMILRNRDTLVIERKDIPMEKEVEWDLKSQLLFRGLVFQSRPVTEFRFTATPETEIVNLSYLTGKQITIRPWQPGDRFIPLGMRKKKKISDFLIDEKMNVFSKKRQLVMTANNEIVWVCGRRISDTVKIVPGCDAALELSARSQA